MNGIGLVAAAATFLSVWFGHVAVRKIESISKTIWIPTSIFATLGLLAAFLSLFAPSRSLSAALGIFAMTLLVDAFQIPLQQKRVMRGHAPANPNNPRHVNILAGHPSATTQNLLKRDPRGHSLTPDEATRLLSPH